MNSPRPKYSKDRRYELRRGPSGERRRMKRAVPYQWRTKDEEKAYLEASACLSTSFFLAIATDLILPQTS